MCKALQIRKKKLISFLSKVMEKKKNSAKCTTLATALHRGGPVLRALVIVKALRRGRTPPGIFVDNSSIRV